MRDVEPPYKEEVDRSHILVEVGFDQDRMLYVHTPGELGYVMKQSDVQTSLFESESGTTITFRIFNSKVSLREFHLKFWIVALTLLPEDDEEDHTNGEDL